MNQLALIPKEVKLNLGCGHDIREDYINVDMFNPMAEVQADVLNLPFEDNYADEVVASHIIEHISWRKQVDLYEEFFRVLKPGGKLLLSYPEFEKCVKSFLENKDGKRNKWWIQTLYGSQSNKGQYHVAPIMTDRLIEQLGEVGFEDFEHGEEGNDSALNCIKGEAGKWV